VSSKGYVSVYDTTLSLVCEVHTVKNMSFWIL